jgi:hypothetical protein
MWIKEANKIGKYVNTWGGFRIYRTKEGKINQRIETREDGVYRVTEFEKGWYVAVNKDGDIIECDSAEALCYKIDFHNL